MKKVAIIGTVGVPASYGGFETLVENIIGENTAIEVEYTVYCSAKSYKSKITEYKKAKLKYISLNANGCQSIIYDIISILYAIRKADVLLILGVSGCVVLPFVRLFSTKRIIVNIDGLEYKRNKWRGFAKKFLRFSERVAVKYADCIIADNKSIQDYVQDEYGVKASMIAYGGDHVLMPVSMERSSVILEKYHLKRKEFSFSVCRIEPENNVHVILNAFRQANRTLVFVGNWVRSEYGRRLLSEYENVSNIMLLDPIYDLEILNVFRTNCLFYIHGHSAGGTNPSLVEAMFFGKPILAFDVTYNRETTKNSAHYFSSEDALIELLGKSYDFYNHNARSMSEIADSQYRWTKISEQYAQLYFEAGMK